MKSRQEYFARFRSPRLMKKVALDRRLRTRAMRCATTVALVFFGGVFAWSQTSSCKIQSADFDGWTAKELSNQWLQLIFVPQLGGRLMQVTFAGHPYLFVNPKYRGKYFPPSTANGKWFNYGGDKLWPMPEGKDD